MYPPSWGSWGSSGVAWGPKQLDNGWQYVFELGTKTTGLAMVGEQQSVIFPPTTEGPHRLLHAPWEKDPWTRTEGPKVLSYAHGIISPFGCILGPQQLFDPPKEGPQNPDVLYPPVIPV